MEAVVKQHANLLAEADGAARMETCDWQLPVRGEEPWAVQLPATQRMRDVARLLVLRTRLEIADGHYDAAIRSLQTGFAMVRDVGEQPTLISGLVGLAISGLALVEVDDLMRAPTWQPVLGTRGPAKADCLAQVRHRAGATMDRLRLSQAKTLRDRSIHCRARWCEQLVHVAAVTKDLIGDPKSAVWPAEVLATAMATKT